MSATTPPQPATIVHFPISLITRFTSLNEGFSTEVRAILLCFCVAHSCLLLIAEPVRRCYLDFCFETSSLPCVMELECGLCWSICAQWSNAAECQLDPGNQYGRYSSIVQSFWMGKSRLLDEFSKNFFTIPINLRYANPGGLSYHWLSSARQSAVSRLLYPPSDN
jgi:hypothetical protein